MMKRLSIRTSVFRVGITEKIELRAGYQYDLYNRIKLSPETFTFGSTKTDGFNNFSLGVRKNLRSQNGLIPTIGLQFTTDFGGLKEYKQEKFNYELRLLLQHKLNKKSVLNTNLSAEYDHFFDSVFARYILSFNQSLTEKLGIMLEAYGTLDENNTELLFDAGLSYLVNKDLQVDLFGGYDIDKTGETEVAAEPRTYFISAGISYRLNKRD